MSTPVQPGEVLDGKYRVETVIGTGGMGVVVSAMHLELRQLVAMKFLLAEGLAVPEVSVRFIREARAAARIRSAHVARVIDVGRLPSGSPYIVMEYLEGSDLDDVLQRGPLSVEDAADYVIQACDAMAEAHRLGIVHRDLKPANLFLARQPDGISIVKVLDFGISKSILDTGSGALTNAGALVGSPLYMSPEQMRSARDVDLRTDIWSLGAVLFELLAGRPPFSSDSIPGIVAAIMTEPPAPLSALRPEMPEGLVAVVMRCLEKDAALRFQDVSELVRALAPFAPGRAQPSVDRVHRIVGSVPPGVRRPSSAPPASSSIPPQSVLPSSQVPISVPRPPGLGSLATAATAAGQGTAPGWTGVQAPRRNAGTATWVLAGALGTVAVVAAGYGLFTSRAPAALGSEPSPSAHPAAASITKTAPLEPPPSVMAAPVSTPAASVAATATDPAPDPKLHRKPSPSAKPSHPASAVPETPRASGLSMKLK